MFSKQELDALRLKYEAIIDEIKADSDSKQK